MAKTVKQGNKQVDGSTGKVIRRTGVSVAGKGDASKVDAKKLQAKFNAAREASRKKAKGGLSAMLGKLDQ